MRVYDGNGVVIEGSERIIIDPHRKKVEGAKIFVSHAHSDHVCVGAKNEVSYHMSAPTHGLIEKKLPKSAQTKTMAFKKHVKGDEYKISLQSSGHILGSSQIVYEGEKKVCVTTDFKLQDSLIQKGADIVSCDILVIESTFGQPEFQFPEREDVYEQMGQWLKEVEKTNALPIISGYSTGKAQELTKVVNEYSKFTPYVHPFVFEKNEIYEKHGTSLGDYVKLNGNLKEAELLVLPPNLCSPEMLHAISISVNKPLVSAKATGWKWRDSFDKVFHLSDHADYNQLLTYVKEAQPSYVFTHHGFDVELARAITQKLGIPARPLEEGTQPSLGMF